VFPKLSKLLNQENALGAPCLHVISSPCRRPARGGGMLRTGVIRHCHIFGLLHPSHHADKR
jgi:hypothetical protein